MRIPTVSRIALGLWSLRGSTIYRDLPKPQDTEPVEVDGPNTLRVLVFGTDAASGWGVLRQDLGLPGHLARALRDATGRGVHVALADCGLARMTDLAAAAEELPDATYDAVVVVGGVDDAVHLGDVVRWREALTTTLTAVHSRSGAHVFVAGIPLPSSLPAFRARAGGTADRCTGALNRVSGDVCRAIPRTTFVTSPSPSTSVRPDERLVSASSYAALAAHLARHMAAFLRTGM